MTESFRPGEVGQCRALARAFLFRFFENEITAGSSDLRSSFFWLLSILVPPGMFLPVMALMKWSIANFVYGAEGVRRVAWMDKTMYIGFSMIAAGAVGTIVWNALVVDRRDTLVLGVQPLRGRTIVVAKLLALGTYVAIFIGGMHTLSSFLYGMLLGNFGDVPFALRGIVAHFVASSLGSAFVLFGVCAIQGVLLATLGPRLFARISPLVQLLLAVIVLESILVASGDRRVGDPLARSGRRRAARRAPARPHVNGAPDHGPRRRRASVGAEDAAHLVPRRLRVDPRHDGAAIARARAERESCRWSPCSASSSSRIRSRTAGWRSRPWRTSIRGWAVERDCRASCPGSSRGSRRRAPRSSFCSRRSDASSGTGLSSPWRCGVALAFAVPLGMSAVALLDRTARLARPCRCWRFRSTSWRASRSASDSPRSCRAMCAPRGSSRSSRRIPGWRVQVCGVRSSCSRSCRSSSPSCRSRGTHGARGLPLSNLLAGLTLGAMLIEVLLWRLVAMPCAEPWRTRPGHLRTWWPVYLLGFLLLHRHLARAGAARRSSTPVAGRRTRRDHPVHHGSALCAPLHGHRRGKWRRRTEARGAEPQLMTDLLRVREAIIHCERCPRLAPVLRAHRTREARGVSQRHVLGEAGARLWRSERAHRGDRPGAGRARRESHGTKLHRRRRGRVGRFSDGRDARQRLRQSADVAQPRRRAGAHRRVDCGGRPLCAAGQQADARARSRPVIRICGRSSSALPNVRVLVALGRIAYDAVLALDCRGTRSAIASRRPVAPQAAGLRARRRVSRAGRAHDRGRVSPEPAEHEHGASDAGHAAPGLSAGPARGASDLGRQSTSQRACAGRRDTRRSSRRARRTASA